ncbi:MAG: hypothetical protein Q9192_004849 [Flavoplaca navasiana]
MVIIDIFTNRYNVPLSSHRSSTLPIQRNTPRSKVYSKRTAVKRAETAAMHVTVIFDAPLASFPPPVPPSAAGAVSVLDAVPLLSSAAPVPPPEVSEPVDSASSADSDVLVIMSEPADVGVEEVIIVMLESPITMEEEAMMLESPIAMDEDGIMLGSSIIIEEEAIMVSSVSIAESASIVELGIIVASVEALVSRLATPIGPDAPEPVPPEPMAP